jgi:hypothetical protein
MQELIELLPEADKIRVRGLLFLNSSPSSRLHQPQVLVLAGAATPYRNDTDRELPFRQESNFFYLTGCNVPGACALISCDSYARGETKIQLFLPPILEADLMWSVVRAVRPVREE